MTLLVLSIIITIIIIIIIIIIVLIVDQTLCNSRCSCLLDFNKITTLIGQGGIKIIKMAYPFVKMLFKFTSLE